MLSIYNRAMFIVETQLSVSRPDCWKVGFPDLYSAS